MKWTLSITLDVTPEYAAAREWYGGDKLSIVAREAAEMHAKRIIELHRNWLESQKKEVPSWPESTTSNVVASNSPSSSTSSPKPPLPGA